jgi:meckelin
VNNPLEPVNVYLSSFLCSFIFLCIAFVQWIWYLIKAKISENGNFCTEFSFLCSVANCSVIIMDENFHGYYIHGKAPWPSGKSDIPLSWLYKNLVSEGAGAYK